jgi:glycosyltransferase involved in cell wall biosynthesis
MLAQEEARAVSAPVELDAQSAIPTRLEVVDEMPPEPRVSVVIPALNEARNLPHVFARLPDKVYEVILVDGHSTDDTVEVARTLYPHVRIVFQSRRGKGNALSCGFAACTGDIIVMLDADGSADGREIPRFVAALRGGADFAKGSRFLHGGGSADITQLRRLGNWGLNSLVNVLYGTRYSDLCYGYNAFWMRCLPRMNVDCDGFEVETLINVRIAKAGLHVTEVPSFEGRRIHGVSNLNAWRDGQRVLKTILAERFWSGGWEPYPSLSYCISIFASWLGRTQRRANSPTSQPPVYGIAAGRHGATQPPRWGVGSGRVRAVWFSAPRGAHRRSQR